MSMKSFAVAGLALAVLLPSVRAADRQPDPFTEKKWVGKYQGASECNDCHTRPTAQRLQDSSDFVLLTEYAIWKTHDKHAQAYAVLEGERGQKIGKILDQNVTDLKTGCMNCHAMSNLFGATPDKDKDPRPAKEIDGVSCGGCHGPSKLWIGPHVNPKNPDQWRLLTPEKKAEMGFRDLRDPEVKARLCMSCHVGNADEGKVVTHAMFAAGHPPLPPIELATFTSNEPQHWRDSKDVPYFQKALKENNDQIKKIYHLDNVAYQRTQLALIGGAVAWRMTMDLAADRANLQAQDPARLWPELLVGEGAPKAGDADKLRQMAAERWPDIAMAHSDCYACHHDLKYPGFRQERGFGYHLPGGPLIGTIPGRPTVRDWSLAFLKSGVHLANKPDLLGKLETNLRALAATSDERPFGEPGRIVKDAQALTGWCDELTGDLRAPGRYTPESVRGLVVHLCRLYGPPQDPAAEGNRQAFLPDYETARELASLIAVAYQEMTEKGGKDAQVEAVLQKLSEELDLQPYVARSKRLDIILKVVSKITGSDDLGPGLAEFKAYIADIGNDQQLRKLPRNAFLRALVEGVSNEQFTQALIKSPTVNELQELSNKELQVELNAVNNYDPKQFLENLNQLAQRLESSK